MLHLKLAVSNGMILKLAQTLLTRSIRGCRSGSKGQPTSYHLSVVVDDHFQGVTLVTRGEDLFPATHVHRLLQALLTLNTPDYLHHKLIMGPDGKKFSKRDQSVTLHTLRHQGRMPDDIYAELGLSPAR